MQSYGKLFGILPLIKDNHHDEVFIEKTGTVVMRNNQWLYSRLELEAITVNDCEAFKPWKSTCIHVKVENLFKLLEWGY